MRITEEIEVIRREPLIKEIFCNFCGCKIPTNMIGTCFFDMSHCYGVVNDDNDGYMSFDICYDCFLHTLNSLAIPVEISK